MPEFSDALPGSVPAPRIVSRGEHTISRSQISKQALNVLYGLHKAGFDGCLVGGGVRDLLLGAIPKDFDVATNALPEQVRGVFRNCRLIGRRFRLAHVHFGRDIVEVATYRCAPDGSEDADVALSDGERILRDNVYGNRAEDALRRDFTINALYYDIADFALLDYVDAMSDIAARRLRMIGDPERRYREDPVRLLRAVRLAAKLDLSIDPATEAPLYTLGPLLETVSKARLFDETTKLLMSGNGLRSYELLRRYDLLGHLFALRPEDLTPRQDALIRAALADTDARVEQGLPVTPAFLTAILLWGTVTRVALTAQQDGHGELPALLRAQHAVLHAQNERMPIPKRFTLPAAEIWMLQARLDNRRRAARVLQHPQLRAAYDFLKLRARVELELAGLAEYWTARLAGEPEPPPSDDDAGPRKRRRRRRGGRGRSRGGEAGAAPGAAAGG